MFTTSDPNRPKLSEVIRARHAEACATKAAAKVAAAAVAAKGSA